jgi:3-hydroxybutyryl-CoA dehydrogenase
MAIKKIGILGAGLMGAGIAQTAAVAGFEVTVVEVNQELIDKGLSGVSKSLAKFVEKGSLSSERSHAAFNRLRGTTDDEQLADVDLIIEAIIENLAVKRDVYARLDRICKPETIFASNTSSLSITEIMTAVSPGRQRRFVGMHFFNPVPLMKLVEAVRTIVTDDEVFTEIVALGEAFGKTVVRTTDQTGFIVNRLLIPYLLDAIRTFESGLATIVDIDHAMKLGCGHPMGPFTLIDFIGLDTVYYIANIMFDEFKEARFAPPPLLKRMVLAGLLGRKSGRGFYDYRDPKDPQAMRMS